MASNKAKDRKAAHNNVYLAKAVEMVKRRAVLLRNFMLNGLERAFNLILHLHSKPYAKHRVLNK